MKFEVGTTVKLSYPGLPAWNNATGIVRKDEGHGAYVHMLGLSGRGEEWDPMYVSPGIGAYCYKRNLTIVCHDCFKTECPAY